MASGTTDRITLVVGGLLLAGLMAYETRTLLTWRSDIRKELQAAGELVETVDANELPSLPRVEAEHSGRVFEAWEKLPLSEPMDGWKLHPEMPPPR